MNRSTHPCRSFGNREGGLTREERFSRRFYRFMQRGAVAVALFGLFLNSAISAQAGPLLDRIKSGEPIRIGYTTARPACFQNESGQLDGFTADVTQAVLKQMGYDKIEPVGVADFGSLIPGLVASRFDIAVCGLYIISERCRNVAFSDPLAQVPDVFLVPAGNPKKIETWQDAKSTGAVIAHVAGTNSLKLAQEAGISPSNMMALPSSTEMIGALLSGRADAGHLFAWDAVDIVKKNPGKLEYSDLRKAPESSRNWSADAFRKVDADFVAKFNEAGAVSQVRCREGHAGQIRLRWKHHPRSGDQGRLGLLQPIE